MKKRIAAVAFILASGASLVYADDNTYDPRALAMGGTGVTTSNTRNAAFQNPSMLASTPRDSFAWEIPIIAVRLQDQNKLHSDINQLKTDGNNLSTALQAFNATPNAANATAAANALKNFNNSLTPVSNKSLMADLFLGTMLAIPGKTFAFSLYVDARAEVGAMFNYATADQTTINTLATNLTQCAAGTAASCIAAQTANTNGQINNLQSQLLVRGVTIKELGISAAHHFEGLGGMDFGITPKMMQLATYDYALLAQQTNTVTLNQGKQSYSAFNMDVGGAKSFKTNGGNEIKTGMVIKNMLSRSCLLYTSD